MSKPNEFVAYLLELLAPLGGVRAQRMFGGFGVYLEDSIFGLVINDVLYLKVDAETRPLYEARGLKPFTYDKQDGSVAVMSYYRAPEDALEDSEELCRWARDACGVGRRSVAMKQKPKKTLKKKKAETKKKKAARGSPRRR